MLHSKNQKELAFAMLSLVCVSVLTILIVQVNQSKEELRDSKEELEEENSNLKEELSNKDKEVSELSDSIEALNDSLKEQSKEIKNLKKDKKKLNKDIEEKQKEIKNLTQLSKQKEDTKIEAKTKASSSKQHTQTMNITAYTAGFESTQKKKGDPGYGITASGKHVKEGVTIACPPSIPFGTKIDIEGIGVRECQDRGSKITEGHIDIYMDSLSEARRFGRQDLKVRVLE